jgi:hypothetical protein
MTEMKTEKRSWRFILVYDGSIGFMLFFYSLCMPWKLLVGERYGYYLFSSYSVPSWKYEKQCEWT